MLNVMIAEDNIALAKQYNHYLSKDKDIKVIGIANDGKTALDIYNEKHPDLVLLDLGLPVISGLSFIETVSNYSYESKNQNIIVISGDSELRLNLCNMRKVYMSMSKPVDFDKLIDITHQFKAESDIKQFPMEKLTDLLLNLNLKTHKTSSIYLQKVIEIAYFHPTLLSNLFAIYGITARIYNCSADKIKSSIRSSVRIINKCTNKDLMCSIFYISKYDINQQISPGKFIELVVEYLKR